MISTHHQVLFVHIPKCAGQSIEMAFLQDVGLSWETRHPFLLRPKEHNERGPERLAHLFGYEYVKYRYITERDFKEFYKFSVVRDPIDRIISELNYRNVKRGLFGVNSVQTYIEKISCEYSKESNVFRHIEPQIKFFLDEKKDEIIVDKVIKFDELKLQFELVSKELGYPNLRLEHRNASSLKHWKNSEISESDIDFLQRYYADDYSFLAGLDY